MSSFLIRSVIEKNRVLNASKLASSCFTIDASFHLKGTIRRFTVDDTNPNNTTNKISITDSTATKDVVDASKDPCFRNLHKAGNFSVDPKNEDNIPMEGRFKNPIVAKLWAARQEAIERMTKSDPTATTSCPPMKGKSPRESETGIGYAFSTDPFLLEMYRNPYGAVRFGKILEDLDALAGYVAFNHVDGNPLLVTAGVDRIRLRHNPLIGNDLWLSGKVTWVGNSSIEIRMQAQDVTEKEEWLEAYFTFVALDPVSKKSTAVAPILPETPEEKLQFQMGAIKAKAKKEARKQKLRFGEQLSEAALAIDKKAALLLEEAGPLLKMPSLADPNSILMDRTSLSNAMVAQPQVRNMYNRIFGGFLMRRGYELAYATAYAFGGDKPRFLEVDEISFDSPVDIGDLLVFHSRVLYTCQHGEKHYLNIGESYFKDLGNHPLVMVEVEAWVTEPEKVRARVSNQFYFTFALPNRDSCRKVLPSNIEQARRMAQRMAADEEQANLRL